MADNVSANSAVTKARREDKRKPKHRPIVIDDIAPASRRDLEIALYEDGLGGAIRVPFIVIRGAHPGPTLGISAAVHGNELNGIKIIHSLLQRVDPDSLSGILVCAPVVNVPGFNAGIRHFSDGSDLNHCFPGKADGKPSSQYARAFTQTFLPPLDILVDIHTASEGRINTMYVRADLGNEKARRLAMLMNPQIVLHARGGDATLRAAARRRDVACITVEAGNPSVFQGRMVYEGELGVLNVMFESNMLAMDPTELREPVICKSSRWLRTTGGGILETKFRLFERVSKRQILAVTSDAFGNHLQTYRAPHEGIVIGMADHPIAVPGTRFCHLGLIGDPTPKSPQSEVSK